MTAAGKRAIGEVALVIAGWALVQPIMAIVGRPLSGVVMFSVLAGIVVGGAAYVVSRARKGDS